MRVYQVFLVILLLSLLCTDVFSAARPSQRKIKPKQPTEPSSKTLQDPVARLDTKVAIDTPTGAWTHNMKHLNKTRLWISQPSMAQAIGVNMVGTVVIPIDLTILPVGYQGEGHLGLTIPPAIWRHWASGVSGSRPEKVHHGHKIPIYNSISGSNSMISESDRIKDEGFYADIVYDVNIHILPFVHQVTEAIMFVYRTLHRTELGLASLLRGKEISPHTFIEPVLLTRLLQVLYESANEIIHGYTLTIMNPKRDWIIESFASHGLLDDVLENILTSAHENGQDATKQASGQSGNPADSSAVSHYPPFYGFRNGLSFEEIRQASELRVQEWSSQVLRIVSDESSRIDQRIDYESQHLQDGSTSSIHWNSMSLFDYLDEKILLYAQHGYNSTIARQQSLVFKATTSSEWLQRLEESLQAIIHSEEATLPSVGNSGEIPLGGSTTGEPSSPEEAKLRNQLDHLNPFARRQRSRGGRRNALDDIMARRGNNAQIPEARRSRKEQVKLVSSIVTSDFNKHADLAKSLDEQSKRPRSGYTSSSEHDRKFRALATEWSSRVTKIFRTFGEGLMKLDSIYENVSIDTKDGEKSYNDSSSEWFQGIDAQTFISILSHLFPTQLALQSYQTYHEASPVYRQSCLTEVFVGRNRSAILDVNAGSFSWGGKGNIGLYGTANAYTSRYGYKQANNLPNADVLGLKPIQNRERNELIMHYYDVDGIKGMKIHLDSSNGQSRAKESDTETGQGHTTPSSSSSTPHGSSPTQSGQHDDGEDVEYDYSEYDPNYQKNKARMQERKKQEMRNASPIDREALAVDATEYDGLDDIHDGDGNDLDDLTFLSYEDSEDGSDIDGGDNDGDDDIVGEPTQDTTASPLSRQPHQRKKASAKPAPSKQQQQKQNKSPKKGTPLPANSARLPRRNKASTTTTNTPPEASPKPSPTHPQQPTRITRGVRRDLDTSDGTVGDEYVTADIPQQPAKQPSAQRTDPPTLNRVKESNLFQEALDNLVKTGKWVENRPSVVGGQHEGTAGSDAASASTLDDLLTDNLSEHDRQAIIDRMKQADDLAAIASMAGIKPDSKLDENQKKELEGKIRQHLEMEKEAVSTMMKNIEKNAAQQQEERATLGDDSITEDLTVSSKKMKENILKRQELLRKRRTSGFSPIDGHRKPGGAGGSGATSGSPHSLDDSQQGQEQPTPQPTKPKMHSLDKIESEMLMLSQLLGSDMCSKGHLDCANFAKELATLRNIYNHEMDKAGGGDHATATKGGDDDEMLNEEKPKSGQKMQHEDVLQREVEVDLSILDGKKPPLHRTMPINNGGVPSSSSTATDDDDDEVEGEGKKWPHTHPNAQTIHYDHDDEALDDVDISLSHTSDAEQGVDNLSSPERLTAILNAMPEHERSKINFGDVDHNINNKKLNIAGIDYYMAHLSSTITSHIDTNIIPPMELSGIDKLYYRRVHFTFYVLTDHADFEPFDVYNIPEIDQLTGKYKFRDDDEKSFHPYQNPQRDELQKKQEQRYETGKQETKVRKTRANSIYNSENNSQLKSEHMNTVKDINANLFHLYQLAIEQVRIRGQQFSYNVVTIPISSEPSLALTLQSALMSSIAPSVHSNPSHPHHYTHHYLQSTILAKAFSSKLDTLSMPLPRNTRHIPIFLLSLASPQPLLLDVHYQAVVTQGIVIGIQTPHSPAAIAQIEHNIGNTYSSLIPSLSPHAMNCNGHKLHVDPRDPLAPMFYSTLSLLFSANLPSASLFAVPQPSPLSLSLTRTQIDSYHRNYLLTAIRTATKVANKATYRLTLQAPNASNACVLEATYSSLDATRKNPFIKEWDGRKVYKLVRKAHRSVRYHLYHMREHISLLEFEDGVKYIRTLVGTAWQYSYLSDLLITHSDRCSYKSSLDKNAIDLLNWDTYTTGDDSVPDNTPAAGNGRPPIPDINQSLRSSYSVQKSPRRRGVGIYVWLCVAAILVGLIIFRSINDIAISIEKKND